MKFQNKHLAISAFVMVTGLTVMSGCAWWPFGSTCRDITSTSSGDVLLTINGTPALTVQEYEEQLDMARKENQQFDMLLQMMPNAEKDFVFRGMATAKLMKAWAEKHGIDKTEKFKRERNQLHEAMDLKLYMKYFDEAHPVSISDSDVENFYHEKKDVIPGLALSQGGVETSFVRFESKDKADKFFDKVKAFKKAAAFKAAAQEHKYKVGDAVINEKSSFSPAIKNVVLSLKKFPVVHTIKADDDSYWVVFAADKTETKYRDLKSPEVQQGLRKMLSDERREKQLEELVNKLKTEMNVVENSKYFEEKENKKRAALQQMQNSADQSESETLDDEDMAHGAMPVKV
ncbi:MAG TPA: hypothetical protein VLG50_03880 [Candidatus Saccharimonadales bacterium]|nr:hypothetical protein [Candidatus Saccharimonadales bacterium]